MKTIGFIGLGNMGKGMSINLAREKMDVVGYDDGGVLLKLSGYDCGWLAGIACRIRMSCICERLFRHSLPLGITGFWWRSHAICTVAWLW